MTTINGEHGMPRLCVSCDETECFYCGLALSKRHEHDHFPVPARAGGRHVVPACYNCHDLKDRMAVAEWPPSAAAIGMADLLVALKIDAERLPPGFVDDRERCMVHLLSQVVVSLALHESPVWSRMSVPGRLLFAKLAAAMTADYPVDEEWKRERRRELLAPWVDRSDPRYSDVGPTLRESGRGRRSVVVPLHAAKRAKGEG